MANASNGPGDLNAAGALYRALMTFYTHQDRFAFSNLTFLGLIQTGILAGCWTVREVLPWVIFPLCGVGMMLTLGYLVYFHRALQNRNVNRKIMDKLAKRLLDAAALEGECEIQLAAKPRSKHITATNFAYMSVLLFFFVDVAFVVVSGFGIFL